MLIAFLLLFPNWAHDVQKTNIRVKHLKLGLDKLKSQSSPQDKIGRGID